METTHTTARALNTRAAKYVASLTDTDPLVEANALIDEALRLQDDGRMDEAERLLTRADALLV
jgi:hypothetical protein